MVTWTFLERDEVDSTQVIAKALAAKGAPEGTTVVAKSQSSGQGRLGRRWVSLTGGLYMSFILRPKGIPRPEFIALVSAVSVVESINQTAGLATAIRWPNDVMARGRKVAGVIAEAQSSRNEITQVVVGVGVNCNARLSDSQGLGQEATSIAEEVGKQVELSTLRCSILDSFSQLCSRLKGGEDMVPLWIEHVATLGKTVAIKLKTIETPFSCLARGIDSEGGLIAVMDGKTYLFHAEDLEWLREQA